MSGVPHPCATRDAAPLGCAPLQSLCDFLGRAASERKKRNDTKKKEKPRQGIQPPPTTSGATAHRPPPHAHNGVTRLAVTDGPPTPPLGTPRPRIQQPRPPPQRPVPHRPWPANSVQTRESSPLRHRLPPTQTKPSPRKGGGSSASRAPAVHPPCHPPPRPPTVPVPRTHLLGPPPPPSPQTPLQRDAATHRHRPPRVVATTPAPRARTCPC